MRLCLFTDTLADVNGVSRFIRNMAAQASDSGRDLRVLTSTRLSVPGAANLANFVPLAARSMPRYEGLELVVPPLRAMLRAAATAKPDAIHVSTPGPVGLVGALAAWRLRIPLLGVYHTDFPAYVGHLFDDPLLTGAAAAYMRLFYRRLATIFTRSDEYGRSLERLGVRRNRIVCLLPGIDTAQFQPSMRDPTIWSALGVPAEGVKVLYVGRVSVEKNLPLLREAWKRVCCELSRSPAAARARLIVVGDGPYRQPMERTLAGSAAHFLGFRHGRELSAIYASSDIFVFPSTTDTLGQVVMEAQSAGLPVLVSDRGGPREQVRDGTTGLVLPAADAGAWARAILALAQDNNRRRAMGHAAHHSMQCMTIRDSFEHFWSVHQSAAGEKAASPRERGPAEESSGRPCPSLSDQAALRRA
jgi:glycosyltransferase involved in cell wall biosynthesis